jgi:hypothetical protein
MSNIDYWGKSEKLKEEETNNEVSFYEWLSHGLVDRTGSDAGLEQIG